MRRPLNAGRLAFWLGLPAGALLLLLPPGEKGGRRPAASPAIRPIQNHPVPPVWRIGDPRVADSSVGGTRVFVELNAADHRDGDRQNPDRLLEWHMRQRDIIERQYGYAISTLNLPAADAERLVELLTARREATFDGRDAAQQLGIVGPEAKAAVRQSVEADTDEIKQLIGSDTYLATLELAPTISTCKGFLEDSVGPELASKGSPLSTDQLYSLAADYVGAVDGPAASQGPQDPDPATGLTPQFKAFLDKASTKLTQDQVTVFHDFLLRQTEAMQSPPN